MNPDRDDTLLDACLDEVLAGRTPPDLSARILQAWAARGPKVSSSKKNGAATFDAAGFDAASFDNMVGSALSSDPIAPPLVAPPVTVVPASVVPPTVIPHLVSPASVSLEASGAASADLIRVRAGRSRSRKSSSYAPLLALSASLLVVAVSIGVWSISQTPREQLAGSNGEQNGAEKDGAVKNNAEQIARDKKKALEAAKLAGSKNNSNGSSPDSKSPVTPSPETTSPGAVASSDNGSGGNAPQVAAGNPANNNGSGDGSGTRTLASPSSLTEVVSFVNTTIDAAWKSNRVAPSPIATEAEYCRRVYLRVLGRIPTVEELEAFLSDKSKAKQSQLVDRLLTADEYRTEYSRYWASIFATALVGRSTGSDDEGPASREGLEQYLRQSIAANKPYSKIAFELITAEGTGEPGTKQFNGAANFMLDSLDAEGALATARVSRVFLGHQLQCAQCHHHPTHEFTQQQYWSVNAFLRQTKIHKIDGKPAVIDVDFVGKSGNVDEAEIYYQAPSGQLRAAYPQYLDGTKISTSGLVSQVRRREELAKFVTTSPQFARATVNRLWSHFFGYGFTRPIDDMIPVDASHSPQANDPVAPAAESGNIQASSIRLADDQQAADDLVAGELADAEIAAAASGTHPELLERLSDEFARSGYDLKMLIRWITLSDAFQRSSKITAQNLVDAPEAGTVPLFSHYYARQMQAEEVYQSLLIAAQLRKVNGSQSQVELARRDWLAQFQRNMATDDAEEESNFNGSMSQSLAMMNGELMQRAVSSRDEGLLRSVVESKMSPREKVEHLFLAALSRRPSRKELDAAEKMLLDNGDLASAVEDIWWALLNSNEFILDH